MADTLDLGSSAKAWGFESLQAHQRLEAGGADDSVFSSARTVNMI